uniref:G-protein coupled receptors family 1 profile domain-containing protein n=3 Tax=Lutzomyia longipalpis TaxID=7200 RepID=A0A1B0CD40_LUTLO
MVSEFDPSSSDSGVVSRCAVVKPLKLKLCQPIFGKKHHRKKNPPKNTIAMHKPSVGVMELEPAIPKLQKQRDPEKEKRRIARKKEKRATLILGLIMGSFIACWLPFFFLYILTPLCTKCQIPESAFAIAFWLGYMNSALNPAIYTIFNKDFRRAFRRILFK